MLIVNFMRKTKLHLVKNPEFAWKGTGDIFEI